MKTLTEVLLTVLALSQEKYEGPMSHVIPPRLASALRTARAKGLVETNGGLYLTEEGCGELDKAGISARPFT